MSSAVVSPEVQPGNFISRESMTCSLQWGAVDTGCCLRLLRIASCSLWRQMAILGHALNFGDGNTQ
eukprot:2490905-Karenia_brevis.AAC.1